MQVERMEKTDRRVKRTHRLLQEALIALILEHGYDAVSIREITERADVGYATFFRHYPDKDALLAAILHQMKDDFGELLAPQWIVSDPEGSSVLFEYVQENFELCKVLLDSASTMALLRPVQEVALKDVVKNFDAQSASPIPVEMAASHLISSLIMMVRWWIEQGMPYTPEEMGRYTAELVIRPLMAAMKK
jgi:AcrR family transcriptional regulator